MEFFAGEAVGGGEFFKSGAYETIVHTSGCRGEQTPGRRWVIAWLA